MLQFGASLTEDTSSFNYNCNMFIIQATVVTNIPGDLFQLFGIILSLIILQNQVGLGLTSINKSRLTFHARGKQSYCRSYQKLCYMCQFGWESL
jgi:hypothetical protein